MQSVSDEDGVSESLSAEFKVMRELMAEDQEIREKIKVAVKDLHDQCKEVTAVLQSVHKSRSSAAHACLRARQQLPRTQELLKQLAAAFPADHYHRYHDHWRVACHSLAFMCAFIHFLESDGLIMRSQLAEMLDVAESQQAGFHIPLEDMLQGFLMLASELSRLAVTSVTYGDYQRPFDIAAFLGQLNSAFQLLNLKNDQLRRRYDGLKYDVKKVEEVVYDLSIRGLKPAVAEAMG